MCCQSTALSNLRELIKQYPQAFLVYWIIFLDIIGFGITVAVLPLLAQQSGANGFRYGLVFSIYGFGSFIVSFIVGRASDRFGRKPIMMLALLGKALEFGIFFIGGSYYSLILARAIAGLAGQSVPAAQSILADIVAKEDRMRFMGWLLAAVSAGIFAGPAISALLSNWELRWSIAFEVCLAIFNLLLTAVFLKETLPKPEVIDLQITNTDFEEQLPSSHEKVRVWDLVKIILSREYIFFFVSVFFSNAGQVVLDVAMTPLVQSKFDATATIIGTIVTTYGLSMIIGSAVIIPLAKAKLRERKTALVGQLAVAVGAIGIGLVPIVWAVYGMVVVHAIGIAIYLPSIPALLSTRSPQSMQGFMLGALAAFTQVPRIVMPLIIGSIMEKSLLLPFVLAVILHILSALSIVPIAESPPVSYKPLAMNEMEAEAEPGPSRV